MRLGRNICCGFAAFTLTFTLIAPTAFADESVPTVPEWGVPSEVASPSDEDALGGLSGDEEMGPDGNEELISPHSGEAVESTSSGVENFPNADGFAGPTIIGAPKFGSTLTVDLGDWEAGYVDFTYQWLRDGKVIPRADRATFTLGAVDVHRSISVEVTGRGDGLESLTRRSTATEAVEPGELTVGTPVINGVPRAGETLTVDPGEWGPSPVHLGYEWRLNGSYLSDAEGASYTLKASDYGQLSVVVYGDKDGYSPAQVASSSVEIVAMWAYPVDFLVQNSTERIGVEIVIPGWYRDESPGRVTASQDQTALDVTCEQGWAWSSRDNRLTASCTMEQPAYLGENLVSFHLFDIDGVPISETKTEVALSAVLDAEISGGSRDWVSGTWSNPTGIGWAFPSDLQSKLRMEPLDHHIAFTQLDDDYLPEDSPTYTMWSGDVSQSRVDFDVDRDLWFLPPGEFRMDVTIGQDYRAVGSWHDLSGYGIYVDYGTIVITRPSLPAPTPSIVGVAMVGNYLTADVGNWPLTGFDYRWYRNGKLIATSESYLLSANDAGTQISVEVVGTPAENHSITSPRSAAVEVQPATFFSTPAPTITGTAAVGKKLKAEVGYWDYNAAKTYQWFANGKKIDGATASSFILTVAQKGKTVTVKVTGARHGYQTVTKESKPTKVIVAGTIAKKPVPTISGTAAVGKKLTAAAGTWDSGVTKTYQWYADGKKISGAKKSTFAPTAKQKGKAITVKVTGKKSGYTSVTKTSKATKKVAVGTISKKPVPTISGTVKVGKKLTAKPGTWDSGVKLTYQWYANGKKIPGATKSSYTLKTAQKGKTITVQVTGKKSGYTTVTKTSKATKKVA